MFCGNQIPQHRLDHDYTTTQLLIDMNAQYIKRWNIELRPDALFWMGKQQYLLECDMGNESCRQLRKRVSQLRVTTLPIVWAAPTVSRIETIHSCCEQIKSHVFYTTFTSARETWNDHNWEPYDVDKGVVKARSNDNERGAN